MTLQLYATCPDEVAALLAKEIASIGGKNIRTAYKVVYFEATEEVFYLAHLLLRMPSRIFRVLKEIPAQTPNIIFSKAKQIRFDRLFSERLAVTIEVVSSSAATEDDGEIPGHLVGSKLREAINDSFQFHRKVLPNQSSRDALIGIRGFQHNRRLMVSVDTSLESLHRRGVRVDGHPAPIKETLAAALLAFCEYDGKTNFYDPMCGSGTIAIEAAQIATGTAPQLQRPAGSFGFEHLLDFNETLWQEVKHRAKAAEHPPTAKIFASDIEPKFIDIARKTAANAGVGKHIQFDVKDFFKVEKPADHGTMILNIPYGLRLVDQDVSPEFMAALGDQLKTAFKGWRCGILAPISSPLKMIGLKPNRKAEFLNGMVPVRLVVFDIY